MAKKQEDNRDIFDKALDDESAFENSPSRRAFKKKYDEEERERNVKGLVGGVAGAIGSAMLHGAGRKIYGKIRGRSVGGAGNMPIVVPVAGGSVGALIGSSNSMGNYPAHDAEMRAKEKRRRK